MVRTLPALLLLLVVHGACAPKDSSPPADVLSPPVQPLPLTLATWNLDNFSEKGEHEPRVQAIANEITALDADIVAVQELKVPIPSDGTIDAAYTTLDELLDGHVGIHAPWDADDTTVGILYRPDRLELLDSRALFEEDWFAFPRPPLTATFSTIPEGIEFTVIVLHLKAFQDGEQRRRDACAKLDAYIRAQPVTQHVVIGDFNDDPFDAEHSNVFADTFLADPEYYDFTGLDLPPASVTSTGWYHYVEGEKIKGEFIDHVLLTRAFAEDWVRASPEIHGVPADEYDAWIDYSSDHFPVSLRLDPASPR